MKRIIILLSFILSTFALIHIRSIVRYVVQNPTPSVMIRTQYLLPCKVCTTALLNAMEFPSRYSLDFEKKAPHACTGATRNKKEQDGCIALLTKHSRAFVKAQNIGEPVHLSCADTSSTNCVKNGIVVLCDKRKKKGYCHMISLD